MEQSSNFQIIDFAALVLIIYGIYLVVTGKLIIWKNKKILNLVHYIKILVLRLTGNRLKAMIYQREQTKTVRWRQHGIFVIVYGIITIFLSTILLLVIN